LDLLAGTQYIHGVTV